MPKQSFTLVFVFFLGLAAFATQTASQERESARGSDLGQAAGPNVHRDDVARARQAFAGFGLDLEEKHEIYRALKELGYASAALDTPDFLLRKSTILAVTEFQRTIGAVATGFLTRDQIEALRSIAARPISNDRDPGQTARLAFESQNLSCQDQRTVYRALYALGHADRRTAFPDFLSDEAVISAVSEYQKGIGEDATGYLTHNQVKGLQADAGKTYLWEHRTCDADQMLFPLNKWTAAGFSESEKKEVFDILHGRGMLTGDRLSNSLSDRDNKAAIRKFQSIIGAEQSGYLTSRQADGILHGWLLPSPKQQWTALAVPDKQLKHLHRALLDLGHFKGTVPIVDFTLNENLIRAVRRYQYASGFPTTGYLTKAQVDLLLAHEITAPTTKSATATKKWSNPVMSWRYANYTEHDLRLIYRALYNRGFFVNEAVNTDLTNPHLVKHIRRYQAYIAADPTGYLTPAQIAGLLRDPGKPTPQEQRTIKRKDQQAKRAAKELAPARSEWDELGYSLDDKKKIYRSLFHLGLAKSPDMSTDFSYRMNLIDVVRAYQEKNGFSPTGFLTSEQAETLLSLNAPLLPSEQQAEFFKTSKPSAMLGFFRALGRQEFETDANAPTSTIVKRLQGRFGFDEHGYITPELFEKAKTIPLRVARDPQRPQTLFSDSEEHPRSKDWGLWKSQSEGVCEISTFSIHEDGFTGSETPAGVALRRMPGWKRNSVNLAIRLRNWEPKSIAELRVGKRTYFFKEAFGRTILVGKNGLRARNYDETYSSLIGEMMRSNGFEVAYSTEFGSKVVVSFSALGFTRQIRAIMNVC